MKFPFTFPVEFPTAFDARAASKQYNAFVEYWAETYVAQVEEFNTKSMDAFRNGIEQYTSQLKDIAERNTNASSVLMEKSLAAFQSR